MESDAESGSGASAACAECGSSTDLTVGSHWVATPSSARVTPWVVCRRCLRASVASDARERADAWAAIVRGAGARGPVALRQAEEGARAVAAGIRQRMAAFGADVDSTVIAFLTHYGA